MEMKNQSTRLPLPSLWENAGLHIVRDRHCAGACAGTGMSATVPRSVSQTRLSSSALSLSQRAITGQIHAQHESSDYLQCQSASQMNCSLLVVS